MGKFEKHLLEEDFFKYAQRNGPAAHDSFTDYSQLLNPNHKSTKLIQNLFLGHRFLDRGYVSQTTSKEPEAVIKVASQSIGRKSLSERFDYISRNDDEHKDKTPSLPMETETGKQLITDAERVTVIEDWAEDFTGHLSWEKQRWKIEYEEKLAAEYKQLTDTSKAQELSPAEVSRLEELSTALKTKKIWDSEKRKFINFKPLLRHDTTHVIFSVGGKADVDKSTAALRRFLSNNFADLGYRYVFGTHNDTGNLHFHVVFHNTNQLTRKRLRFDKADLFMLRQDFSKHLYAYGIKRAATLRKDRAATIEAILKGAERIKERVSWYESKIQQQSPSFNAIAAKADMIKKVDKLIERSEFQLKHMMGLRQRAELKDGLEELETVRQGLKKVTVNSVEKDQEATLSFLNRKTAEISKKIDELGKGKESIPGPLSARRSEYIKNYHKKHVEEINEAMYALHSIASTLSPEQKKHSQESMRILDNLAKATKAKGKDIG